MTRDPFHWVQLRANSPFLFQFQVDASYDFRIQNIGKVASTAKNKDAIAILNNISKNKNIVFFKNKEGISKLIDADNLCESQGISLHQGANWYFVGNPLGFMKAAAYNNKQ